MQKRTIVSLIEKLNRCPPFLIFYRRSFYGKRPNYNQVIAPDALSAGLSEPTFRRMSKRTNWNKFTLQEIDAFMRACRFNWSEKSNLLHRFLSRHADLRLKHRQPLHPIFRHLNAHQLRRFNRLCEQWEAEQRPSEEKCP